MPVSSFHNLTPICEKLVALKPKRVLDIGCGAGKWGVLVREYAELWGAKSLNRTVTVEAVEIWAPYINALHKAVYDKIHIGNAIDLLPTLGTDWDLVLCVDMLEHVSFEKGIALLNWIKENSKVGILALPTDVRRRGAPFGNPYEEHIAPWTADQLQKFGELEFSGSQTILVIK